MILKCSRPEECAELLKAIAEENRIKILRLLLKGDNYVNNIAEELKMKQYHVSRHLTILKKAGLVQALREGKRVKYKINPFFRGYVNKDTAGSIDLGCCMISFRPLPEYPKKSR
jgi:ArsR family transcriptional regulator